VPADEVAAYATALLPVDEAFAEPAELTTAAISDALDGRTLSRDDLHQALRDRLPIELLPWCPGCKSHHVRRGALVLAGLRGRLCIAGRAGRQPAFARTDQWIDWQPPAREQAGAELVRRYREGYGASNARHFAQWAGLAPEHANEWWALVPADDHAPAEPPRPPGVRLLMSGDPLLLGRDREALIPDDDLRARVFTAISSPGVVLADGGIAALWRARKQGSTLAVTAEQLEPLDQAAVRAQADRLAPHRGCTSASVSWV
jgi:hypothetical protein